MSTEKQVTSKPTPAFIGASWVALMLGMLTYLIGLWNANMQLNEKGYYLTLLLFGLFAVVSVQKSVRDRAEGVPVTNIYYGLAWFSVLASLVLLAVGLWNANLLLSEKGFYGMSFALSLFAAVAVQKNVRDLAQYESTQKPKEDELKTRQQVPVNQPPVQVPMNQSQMPPKGYSPPRQP